MADCDSRAARLVGRNSTRALQEDRLRINDLRVRVGAAHPERYRTVLPLRHFCAEVLSIRTLQDCALHPMGTLSDQLESLVLRFPAQAAMLRRLYMREPSVRAMCDEYNVALRAYQHWKAGKRELRKRDYHQIMQELEIEIQEQLKKEAQRAEE
jgi:hypothetical protein